MVLEALRNLLMMNPGFFYKICIKNCNIHFLGVELLLIGHFKTLFQYLHVHTIPEIQLKALQIISIAANNKQCINDIACSIQLSLLLILLVHVPRGLSHQY